MKKEEFEDKIICPHCKETFKLDEAGYADILKQVRDHQFEKELHERLELAEKEKENAIKFAQERTKNELMASVSKKETEITELKAEKNTLLAKLKSEKDAEIACLQAKLDLSETDKKLAVSEALSQVVKERDELANELKSKETEKQLHAKSLKEKFEIELKSKDDAIAYYKDMKAKLSTKMVGETLEQHCEWAYPPPFYNL